MKKVLHGLTASLFLIACLAATATRMPLHGQSAERVAGVFEKIQWRGIGPAIMGGRTVDIDVVESRPSTIYAAVGPSGVWKSENNGVTWASVFSQEATVSAGAVAVSQSNPSIVWVGAGESTCRNSVAIGDGVYKSEDGGQTWMNMGLKETRHISRIVINRGDPNIVHVAAMGHLWGPNSERGVFRTIDGGKNWQKTLYVNDNTGIADLAVDPLNSLILYAAAYEHRRLPCLFTSGGQGSGLYRSEDGGASWKRLIKDLPEGIMGRIGIGVSRSRPGVIYALIEHQEGGIWRSEDFGESWKRTCDPTTFKRVNTRPFYYSQIRVDPANDRTVYVLSTGLFVSKDMGQKFRSIGAGIHLDHHGLWIDPSNPLHLIDGNDGGIDISYDGGKNWQAIQNMDLAEVYQVDYDMKNPYQIYIGLQDNGAWVGPSDSLDSRGIANEDWTMIQSGDGFFVKPDPSDPNTVYSNSQMNGIQRFDRRIHIGKSIRPASSWEKPAYRFNWNAPIYLSPHDPKTVYCAGNHLFRTTDGGDSWQIISPDLTTNDPAKQKDSGGPISFENSGAEVHCTIVAVSESPLERGVIWCGTDDGNLQLTRDGGKTWTNVAENIPGLPKHTWCSRVEASHFDSATAYATFDGHRTDDYSSYIFRTLDYGKKWTPLKGNLPFGWIHVIREDLKNRNLLFLGTEFGIFSSLDSGTTWFSLKNNLPTVAVHDIAIHPRDNDLIIGTHGRGVWILDDISFLQEMSEAVLESDFYLFDTLPATLFLTSIKGEPACKSVFLGKNPSFGAQATYWFKSDFKENIKISFKDSNGNPVSEMNLIPKSGLHRDVWDLLYVPATEDGRKYTPSGMGFQALPTVPPGKYSLEVVFSGTKFSKTFDILPDPIFFVNDDQRASQAASLAMILKISKKLALAVTAAKNIRRHLISLQPDLSRLGHTLDPLHQTALNDFTDAFERIENAIVPKDFSVYYTSLDYALRGGPPAHQLLFLGMSIAGHPSGPTKTERLQLNELSAIINASIDELNQFIRMDIPRFNEYMLQPFGLKSFPNIPEAHI